LGDAGGPAQLAGDYLYGDHRAPYQEAGLWGLFRVYKHDATAKTKLLHLECERASCGGGGSGIGLWLAVVAGALVIVAAAGYIIARRRAS